jgi:hypothetical protein
VAAWRVVVDVLVHLPCLESRIRRLTQGHKQAIAAEIDTPLPLCYVEDSDSWPIAKHASKFKIDTTEDFLRPEFNVVQSVVPGRPSLTTVRHFPTSQLPYE